MSKSAPHPHSECCAAFQLDNGDTIIYDPTNPPSWIQSDVAFELVDVR